jgi:ankyrin repeat protein
MADALGEPPIQEEEHGEESSEEDDDDVYVEEGDDDSLSDDQLINGESSSSSDDGEYEEYGEPPEADGDEDDEPVYSENGDLPSFVGAFRQGRPLSVIRAIVELQQRRDPDFLVRRFSRHGGTPLHLAIEYGASLEIIRYLVGLRPETLTLPTESLDDQALPLQLAITSDSPDDVIRFLLTKWPTAARRRTRGTRFALQLAARDRYTPLRTDTLQHLIRAWPDALRVHHRRHGLPLHMLFNRLNPMTADAVAAFVEPFPDALRAQDGKGRLPLHGAAQNQGVSLDVLEYLVERCPESVRLWARHVDEFGNSMRDGKLAIHLALESYASLERARFFLEQWPESIRQEDGEGDMPVHTAAKHILPPGTFRFVVEQWPESVRVRNSKGLLPVHLATRDLFLDNLRFIVEVWPESVNEVDGTGATPLHLALGRRSGSIFGVVQYLIPRSPDALRAGDDRGRRPLHLAAALYVRSDYAVRTVAEGWPDAVRVADNDGNLPVHVALSAQTSLESVRYLVDRHPDSLLHRNGSGLLPIQVALSRPTASMDVVRFLVEQRPESLQERDANGRVLLHFVLSELYPIKGLDGIDSYLIEQWPSALQVRDSAGLLPLHIAASAENATLDLVYRLARFRPELLCRGLGVHNAGDPSARAVGEPSNPLRRSGLRLDPTRRSTKRARTGAAAES